MVDRTIPPALDDLTSPLEPRQGGRSLQSGIVKPSANRNMIMQMLKNVTFGSIYLFTLALFQKAWNGNKARVFLLNPFVPKMKP